MITIAIFDDMPILRETIKSYINMYEEEKGMQFSLYQFDSGEEFIEESSKYKIPFDLIFMDYYMKKLNGVETSMYIRKCNLVCDIVFVTSSENRYELMSVNPLQILSKPVQKEDIFNILNQIVTKMSNY